MNKIYSRSLENEKMILKIPEFNNDKKHLSVKK